jgi:putative protease
VKVSLGEALLRAVAVSEDGRVVSYEAPLEGEPARSRETLLENVRRQVGKRAGHYVFEVTDLEAADSVPFLPAGFLNGIRRALAEKLDELPVKALPLRQGQENPSVTAPESLSYKANIASSADRALYASRGAASMEDAYELSHRPGAELMRSKYCVRHELGLCPKQKPGLRAEPLFLRNAGKRLRLDFHCATCEMTVKAVTSTP